MHKSFTVIVVVFVILMTIGFIRKGKSVSQPSIAVIPKGMTHDFWKFVHKGAEEAGNEFGARIYWNAPEIETDREKQIQIVEDFVIKKVSGIVLAPLDDKALVPLVEKLHKNNIPCVIIDSNVQTDKYLSFVATDNYAGGVMAARRMGNILGGVGNVIVVKYAQGSASTTNREDGFIETIEKEFPDITIVDSQYGMATVETALQTTEDMLTRNQNVQGLYACNASTSVGAMRALMGQQRTEIKMVGFDAEDALVKALKEGTIDSLIVQNPYKMGYEGVKAILESKKGKQIPKRIDTGVTVVTQDNMDQPEISSLLKLQNQ